MPHLTRRWPPFLSAVVAVLLVGLMVVTSTWAQPRGQGVEAPTGAATSGPAATELTSAEGDAWQQTVLTSGAGPQLTYARFLRTSANNVFAAYCIMGADSHMITRAELRADGSTIWSDQLAKGALNGCLEGVFFYSNVGAGEHLVLTFVATGRGGATTVRFDLYPGQGGLMNQCSAQGDANSPLIRDPRYRWDTAQGIACAFIDPAAVGQPTPQPTAAPPTITPQRPTTAPATPAPPTPAPPTSTPAPAKKVIMLVHGWQGINFGSGAITYSCSQGATKYTGSGDGGFGSLPQELTSQGYTVYFAHWTTGPATTIRAEEAARNCLSPQILDVRRAEGVGQVLLIAHSMGGLVSRAYIEQRGLYRGDVSGLVTLGSPHTGVNVGWLLKRIPGVSRDYCRLSPGTCQLSYDEMDVFNTRYQPSGRVPYSFVGGDGGNGLGTWPLRWVEGPNDSIVGVASATGYRWSRKVTIFPPRVEDQYRRVLSGPGISTRRTGDYHVPYYEKLNLAPGYFSDRAGGRRCIRSFLGLPGSRDCGSFNPTSAALLQEVPETATTVSSFTATITDTVPAGTTRTYPVRIDGPRARVWLSWDTGDLGLTLIAPDGTAITPVSVGQQLPGSSYAGAPSTDWLSTAVYDLVAPATGEWKAVVTGQEGGNAARIALFAELQSPLTLQVERPSFVTPGETFTVTARLLLDGVPVAAAPGAPLLAGVSPQATVDDQVMQEQAAGVYVATVTAPAAAGTYPMHILVSGASPEPFSRQEDWVMSVYEPQAQAALQSEEALDTDGSGRYDVLRLSAGLAINTPGTYAVTVRLSDSTGATLTETRIEKELQVGNQQIVFDLNGRQIGASGVSGPYAIDLILTLAEQDAPALVTGLGRTDRYRSQQFDGSQVHTVYLPVLRR